MKPVRRKALSTGRFKDPALREGGERPSLGISEGFERGQSVSLRIKNAIVPHILRKSDARDLRLCGGRRCVASCCGCGCGCGRAVWEEMEAQVQLRKFGTAKLLHIVQFVKARAWPVGTWKFKSHSRRRRLRSRCRRTVCSGV